MSGKCHFVANVNLFTPEESGIITPLYRCWCVSVCGLCSACVVGIQCQTIEIGDKGLTNKVYGTHNNFNYLCFEIAFSIFTIY